jgi:DNA-nicking Smr family endonuclease
MKIGDKVRFLNSVGGGIVTGFQGKDIVIVDDGGFDTPALIRECVVIEPAGEAQVRQSSKPVPEPAAVPVQKNDIPVVVEETKEGEQITVCLAYLPVDIKQLSSTSYECYLVNDSNYFLSYNYMSRTENGWVNRATGLVEPNTKLFLEEFDKSALNDLEKICFQYIAYKKDKPFSLKNPCSSELRIDTVKFYKLHSFRENDYFEDDALIYYIVRQDLPERELLISTEELEQAMREKERSNRPKIERIEKKPKNVPIEIDLHINELIDSVAGLEPKDMLDYQLKVFRNALEENKKQKGQKIVFIHGKGNGVLKNAIINELKSKYKNYYYQDASFREYGFGATMVTIK